MADNTILPIPQTTGDTIAADDIGGIKFQRVKMTLGADGSNDGDVSSANPLPVGIIGTVDLSTVFGDGDPVTTGPMLLVGGKTAGGNAKIFETNASGRLNISDGGGSITVDAISLPLPTGAATETTLADLNGKILTSATMPTQNAIALPVRQAPQQYWDWSFAKAITNNIDTTRGTLIRTGSGQTVNQTGGNLVITSGTTVNAETVIRTIESWSGALTVWEATTLSQRIVNNNFYVELVDVIGDGLAYNIVNTTTVDVTKTSHGFTAENVGQRIDLCALSSVGVPMEGVIASIPDANTIRFTVAGWPASGSGTLSLTGWNKIELNYTGTTATNVNFNTRRQGYQNTSVAATINTSASGHQAAVNISGGVASLSDQVLTSAGVLANRNTWKLNVPETGIELYLQIRCRNGTTAPASTTTWTLGMLRVEDYIAQQVELTSTRQQSSGNSLPVTVLTGSTTAVTGTVTATVTGGTTLPVTPTTTFTNSTATTNGTVIKASAGTLWNVVVSNVNAAARYLKFYNSTTVTVGTTTPVMTITIPAGGTVNIAGGSNGIRFATGICLGITTGMADADTGAVAANEIKVATTFT